MRSRIWTREETLAAFNLYCRTPFGRLHALNPDIIGLAQQLGRAANAELRGGFEIGHLKA